MRSSSDPRRFPTIPHHAQPGYIIACVAVVESVAAAGIGGDHPAESTGRRAGRVRGDASAHLCQFRVELVQHNARLDSHSVGRNREDSPEVDAQIENNRRAERLAGKTRTRAARNDRKRALVAILHQSRNTLLIFRYGNSQWLDLKRAGIGGIQPAREPVEVEPPTELPAKIVGDLLGVDHNSQWTVDSESRSSQGEVHTPRDDGSRSRYRPPKTSDITSLRVMGSSRKPPRMELVMVMAVGLRTPRMVMHE